MDGIDSCGIPNLVWMAVSYTNAAQVPMPDALALVALAKVSPVREHGVCPVAVCCRKNRPCRPIG